MAVKLDSTLPEQVKQQICQVRLVLILNDNRSRCINGVHYAQFSIQVGYGFVYHFTAGF